MGRHVVRVPDVGEGIAEVELVGWSVAVGDAVERNQVLAEVMTDKANVEIPSPVTGVIASLHGAPGDTMSVGLDLIELSVVGGDERGATSSPAVPVVSAAPPAPFRVASVPSTPAMSGDSLPPAAPRPAPSPAASPAPATAPASPAAAPTPAVAAVGAPLHPLTPEQRDRGVTLPFPQPRHKRSEQPAPATGPAVATPAPAAISASVAVEWAPPDTGRIDGDRPRAAPAVRHRATNLGIDLGAVDGAGPGGRITHGDLDRYLLATGRLAAAPSVPPPARAPATPPAPEAVSERLIGLRRRIARRMAEATTTIPHITYVEEVDVTAVEELRATFNAEAEPGQARLTLLPFLIRALAVVVPDHPSCNAQMFDAEPADEGVEPGDGTLVIHSDLHVGIATQTERGLMVPVINEANTLDLHTLAARVMAAAERARNGSATPAELTGSTITITSLGALGGLATSPVINKPEVAIVGVNKIATRPVWRDGAFVPRKVMHLSSSFDHRVIDGWVAAQFIQGIRRVLEQPALLFVDR